MVSNKPNIIIVGNCPAGLTAAKSLAATHDVIIVAADDKLTEFDPNPAKEFIITNSHPIDILKLPSEPCDYKNRRGRRLTAKKKKRKK